MRIAALLSGGVDSSVALNLLLQNHSHDLRAFYLKIWLEEELSFLGDCPWEEDLRFARAICEQARVPLRVVSLQSEYREMIVEEALRELRAGRTPSPDVFCNQRIKFGEFCSGIDSSWDRIASGHYAQISCDDETYYLERSPDPVKDQTYFLSALSQAQLKRSVFPIGHLTKAQVRHKASELALPNRHRKDSQGLCFLGKINYRDFVKFHLGERQGDIVDLQSGERMGKHQGFWFYTIGQRHGLGLSGGPWFVARKDPENNILFVHHQDNHLKASQKTFTVGDLRWISKPPTATKLQVKLRHGPETPDCRIEFVDAEILRIEMERPDPGIAPGQHAVLYEGITCLGGGIIQ